MVKSSVKRLLLTGGVIPYLCHRLICRVGPHSVQRLEERHFAAQQYLKKYDAKNDRWFRKFCMKRGRRPLNLKSCSLFFFLVLFLQVMSKAFLKKDD